MPFVLLNFCISTKDYTYIIKYSCVINVFANIYAVYTFRHQMNYADLSLILSFSSYLLYFLIFTF